MKNIFCIVLVCLLSTPINSWSLTYQADFAFTAFQDTTWHDRPSPYSSIEGSLVFESDTPYLSAESSLSSVNFSLGTTAFNTSNTTIIPQSDGSFSVRGVGVSDGAAGSDSFILSWNASEARLHYSLQDYVWGTQRSAWNSISSNFSLTEILEEPEPTPEPQQHALLYGWENNGTASMLSYLLGMGWDSNNIHIIPEEEGFDESYINNLDVNPGDQFLFYYKGHGATNFISSQSDDVLVYDEPIIGNFGETHLEGTFTVLDQEVEFASDEALKFDNGDTVTDDELTHLFSADKWDNVLKLFVLDSCLSGGFNYGADSDGNGDLNTLENSILISSTNETSTTKFVKSNGVDLLEGAEYETFLTNFVLEKGIGEKLADGITLDSEGNVTYTDPDGIITLDEIILWQRNYKDYIGTVRLWSEYIDYFGLLGDFSGPIPDGVNVDDFIGEPQIYINNVSDSFYGAAIGIDSLSQSEPVPEPSTILLLGSGIIALASWHRRQTKKK